MKKILTYFLMLIAVIVYAVPERIDGSNAGNVFESKHTDATGTTLEFNIPELEIEELSVSGKTFQRFKLDEYGHTSKTGYPELPVFNSFVAIPNTGGVSLDMTVLEEQVYRNMDIYPAQEVRLDGSEPEFSIDHDYYVGSKRWTQPSVQISEPMIMRDVRIATVTVNPMQYDPETRELRVLRRVKLNVRNEGGIGVNELQGDRKLSRSFEKTYRSIIPNYDAMRDEDRVYQQRSMIVIYPNNTSLNEYVASFIDWKRTKGFKVIDAPSNVTGTSCNSIKNYIQDQYEELSDPPEYVVLIGDADGSLGIDTWNESVSGYDGEGDYPYTLLDGNDYLPEMFIGRISISDADDMLTYLAKVNIYEREIYMDEPEFYEQSLLVGDTTPSGLSCIVTNKYIKELILTYSPDHSFTEIYGGDPPPNAMNNAMNNGTLIFDYRGFSGMSGYGNSHIDELDNVNKLVNTVINTCGTGSFQGTARTEAFIRAGTSFAPTGAICSIGMATIGTHTQFNNTLTSGIFAGIYEYDMRTMGEALVRGELQMYQTYHNVDWMQTQAFIHWCNLMGDPTVDIWAGMPKDMVAEYQSDIPKGQNYIEVTVTDDQSMPLEEVWVTARMGQDDLFASDYTDENGYVVLYFDGTLAGDVDLTITKPDYRPILGGFDILSTGDIAILQTLIDDDSSDESEGNDDGEPNPGETIELLVNLINYGSTTVNNLTATLSTDDPYIDITDSEEDFGNIAPEAAAQCADDFGFYIHTDVPDNHVAEFVLNIPDQGEIKFWVPIRGVDLDVVEWDVADNGNGVFDSGETAPLHVTVVNNGAQALEDVYAELESTNDFLEISDSIAYFGDIAIGQSVECTGDAFNLTAMAQLITGMTIKLKLHLYNDDGYNEIEEFIVPIGIVTIEDPLGPDEGGYMCYDSGDVGYYQAPEYQWIEIDPNEGGHGTDTGISDTGQEGEAIDGIATVDLPFTFRFYGKAASRVTICSNGWITFGETEQVTFRNFPVPGPMGPSPMVAAFWDDLYTTGGGVYTWYDEDNHYFVIEWSDCRNSVGNASETFEIILYDPAFYTTFTGNGEIKIQYQTFNNVDSYCSDGGPQGNYCSIGIEDHTALRGLQYTYNNEYPTAARPLQDEMAILFTGIPICLEEAYLTMGEMHFYESNGNGYIEPGETVNLGIGLNNIGESDATGVRAILSSSDSYVEITSDDSFYPDIASGAGDFNNTFYTFHVSPDVPHNHLITFQVEVYCSNDSWNYSFARRVYKPDLELLTCLLNDENGDGNGNADPGEQFVLAVSLHNPGMIEATNVEGTISSSSPYLDILTPEMSFGAIPQGEAIQVAFQMELSSSTPAGAALPLVLDVTADHLESTEFDLAIGSGLAPEIIEEHFDNWLPEDWTIEDHTENWSRSNTQYAGGDEPEAMLNWNPEFSGTTRLISFPMNLLGATNVSMDFKHAVDHFNGSGYNLGMAIRSDNYDWTSLWEISPVNSVNAQEIHIDIDQDYLNSPGIQFCWYLDGSSFSMNGWYIDDIVLNAVLGNSATISGVVTLDEESCPVEEAVLRAGLYATHPDTTGYYKLYVSPGEYEEFSATMDFFEPGYYNDLDLEFGDTLEDYDFNLSYFRPPTALTYEMEDDTIALCWNYDADRETRRNGSRDQRVDFSHFSVYRQIATGAFIEIETTEDLTYSEVIDTTRDHQYYVEAVYATGISDSTNHVTTGEESPHGTDPNEVPAYVNNLGKNYPNPFNPETTIRFSLASDAKTELAIYNVKGQRVKTLVNDKLKAGSHTVRWQGRNDAGKGVSSGVYLYKLKAGDFSSVQKMLLLK